MKKTVYSILIYCLIIGLCLIIMDELAKDRDGFNVPSRFSTVIVDLSDQTRKDELLFASELRVPSRVEFIMQSDAKGEKNVKLLSEAEIMGTSSREINFIVGRFTGSSSIFSSFVMDKGKYAVYLTSEKMDGKIAVGYQETALERSEFERLYKIHKGDLNNPPKGYIEIFSTTLAGQSCQEEIIYTLSLDKPKYIGLSVYTSAEQGRVTVDFIGGSSNFMGLVNSQYTRICDQLETTLPPGEYQFKLTCENADGQLYIFLKQ